MTQASVCDNLKYILVLSVYSKQLHFPICGTKDIFAHLMIFNLRTVLFIFMVFLIQHSATGQLTVPDSSGKRVISAVPVDSMFKFASVSSVYGPFAGGVMAADQIFHSAENAPKIPVLLRKTENRDWVFYFYCGILLFLSFIQLAFDRYFIDLFRVFFNTSLRQKQIREQLTQASLPSLLLNILFFISGGLFTYFLLDHYHVETGYSAPIQILMAISAIALIYLAKYVFLSLLGWIFDKREASESYLFNVFMVNKVAGLILIPLGVLLAYSSAGWKDVFITLAGILIVFLLGIRLVRCFSSVRHGLKINVLHFLVFMGAFEVIPLMVIYRLFLRVIE